MECQLIHFARTSGGIIQFNTGGNLFYSPHDAVAISDAGGLRGFDAVGTLARGYGLSSNALTPDSFRASYILHELGHILGGFSDDSRNSQQSLDFHGTVLRDCLGLPATTPRVNQ